MKQRLLFCVLLMLIVGIKAQAAFQWTDDNGVKWTFSQRNYSINGESQLLWAIDGASGYGEEVIIPPLCITEPLPVILRLLKRCLTITRELLHQS